MIDVNLVKVPPTSTNDDGPDQALIVRAASRSESEKEDADPESFIININRLTQERNETLAAGEMMMKIN